LQQVVDKVPYPEIAELAREDEEENFERVVV
jgi:hypothetical protein